MYSFFSFFFYSYFLIMSYYYVMRYTITAQSATDFTLLDGAHEILTSLQTIMN